MGSRSELVLRRRVGEWRCGGKPSRHATLVIASSGKLEFGVRSRLGTLFDVLIARSGDGCMARGFCMCEEQLKASQASAQGGRAPPARMRPVFCSRPLVWMHGSMKPSSRVGPSKRRCCPMGPGGSELSAPAASGAGRVIIAPPQKRWCHPVSASEPSRP